VKSAIVDQSCEFYTIHGSVMHVHVIIVVLFIVAMQGQAIWRELLSVEDPHLNVLARGLYTTVLGSKAPTTARKYTYAFN